MKRVTPHSALAAGAAVVTVALTAAAFWLSYEHLHDVAAAHGLGHAPERAWAWPATVDLFIVAGELLILRASLRGTVDRWAIALAATGSLGSIALNVAGVGQHAHPLDYVVAAVPPVAALLAFGALMRQVHDALSRTVAEPVAMVERADAEPVMPTVAELPSVPLMWDRLEHPGVAAKLPAVVPAETARQVVTEPVTEMTDGMTAAELRREARRLNRRAVKDTGRPVTIDALRDGLGLSRRQATELRREVVRARRRPAAEENEGDRS